MTPECVLAALGGSSVLLFFFLLLFFFSFSFSSGGFQNKAAVTLTFEREPPLPPRPSAEFILTEPPSNAMNHISADLFECFVAFPSAKHPPFKKKSVCRFLIFL